LKTFRWHPLRRSDDRHEVHQGQNILRLNPRSEFAQFQSGRGEFEHRAFGDELDPLPARQRRRAVKTNLLDAFDKFRVPTFAVNS
jgi:hypothetical protein